ncbi:MAG: hypothetical protein KGI49_01315 [Patescibacteria group bacterium]|nr:hypothetical protein [Patescibacteria group bacterium]
MNKTDKYIKKLPPKKREEILEILRRIKEGIMAGLDFKKLKGYDNYFRVRKGDTRIIFHLDINGQPEIRSVGNKDDNTYRRIK